MELLARFPAYTTYGAYRTALASWLDRVDLTTLSSAETSLVDVLKHLLEIAKPDRGRPGHPKRMPGQGWQDILPATSDDADSGPAWGAVAALTFSEAEPDIGEGPQTGLLFVAEELDGDVSDMPSEEEIDAGARESRHWISRHQRLVPGDPGRFTPPERRRVASFIRAGLASGDRSTEAVAALLGLMYVTGQDLEAVSGLTVGMGGEVDVKGIYHRTLRPPTGAYRPTPEASPYLAPSADRIGLPLPDPLDQWAIAQIGSYSGSLMQCLGITRDEARRGVAEAVEILRDGGRFQRIRLERIRAALAVELAVAWHDPVITHLLAAGPNQAAPMLGYYVAHSIERLTRVYAEVTREMMERG